MRHQGYWQRSRVWGLWLGFQALGFEVKGSVLRFWGLGILVRRARDPSIHAKGI